MSFISILETLIIGPLKLVFEFVFQCSKMLFGNPGLSIISLSLIINILVLPLYRRADEMQKEAHNVEQKLREGVEHIKKTFSGDERMMMQQTYYRQNNYKPTDAFKGSVSLLLQIPFFMAAYGFLSNLQTLHGASLGPIKDLGAPDGLLVIGGIAINVLPVLMTFINFISSAIYLKGFPLKNKVQIYGMAIVFLVLLYDSPAGLVFYWTLNNLFSLVKTIFYKINNPSKVLRILISAIGIVTIAFSLFVYSGSLKRKIFFAGLGVMMQIVLFIPAIQKFINKHGKKNTAQPNKKLFFAGSCFLTVLVGVLISSTVIAASPQEFVDVNNFHNPLWYILSTFCMAAGTFLIWLRVFYWLAKPNLKVIFDKMVWVLSGVMLVNYMFFGRNLGNLSATLQYDHIMSFTSTESLVNIVVLFVISVGLYFIATKWRKVVTGVICIAIIAITVMSSMNIFTIKKSIDSISAIPTSESPHFQLDKNGQNVVVIMLDRAVGEYVPYIFNEKPELKEVFDGFTYYSNTISFGKCTNFGIPPLMGGYEYTPVEMNKRDTEPLVSKHNEAVLLMPVLFDQNDYDVTVCDPVYANYSWIPDLSIFDNYPDINAYITKGEFDSAQQREYSLAANHRNFFCFSIMKCMPLFLQPQIYKGGGYRMTDKVGQINYSNQTTFGMSIAHGYRKDFLKSYNVLNNLSNMSNITENNQNTFLFISNDITHNPTILKEPDYTPEYEVDNTKYDAENADRFTLNGKTLNFSTSLEMAHYHANVAAFVQIGNWLEYLKEKDVYDNTRIILVADHGASLHPTEELKISDVNLKSFFPLLMVKDFNGEGFTTSNEFMTNADVPTLATNGLINNPTNPFTGKLINNDEKNAHEQMIFVSEEWLLSGHRGNTFSPARWASVSKNSKDKNNWKVCNESVVLKEHELP